MIIFHYYNVNVLKPYTLVVCLLSCITAGKPWGVWLIFWLILRVNSPMRIALTMLECFVGFVHSHLWWYIHGHIVFGVCVCICFLIVVTNSHEFNFSKMDLKCKKQNISTDSTRGVLPNSKCPKQAQAKAFNLSSHNTHIMATHNEMPLPLLARSCAAVCMCVRILRFVAFRRVQCEWNQARMERFSAFFLRSRSRASPPPSSHPLPVLRKSNRSRAENSLL